jgi:hypothetical protein
MMRYIYSTILFLLIFYKSHSQNISYGDLKKYSYLIRGVHGNFPVLTATGFIINYRNKNYLVTNFHVLTGLDPNTHRKITEKPDKINIWFKKPDETYGPSIYFPLYDPNGFNLFYVLKADSFRFYDIAILPLSETIKSYNLNLINEKNIDSSSLKKTTKLFISGFPNGTPVDGWAPTVLEVSILTPTNLPKLAKGEQREFVDVFYDKTLDRGSSGSPVFASKNGKDYKVIGVNSLNPIGVGKQIKGAAVFIKFVPQLIDKMNNGEFR